MEENFIFIIITLVVGVIAFKAGWHMRSIMLIKGLSENPDHFIKLLEQVKQINAEYDRDLKLLDEGHDISAPSTELAIEQVNNMLYAYAKDTNQFVAQGTTMDALMDQAQAKFPGRRFFGTIAKTDSAKELV